MADLLLAPEAVVRREWRESLEMLSDLLGTSEFVCGAQLTRADLSVAATLDQFSTSFTPGVAE